MKHYYSSESDHGTESSFGFANDTTVSVWASKKDRDNYLSNVKNISAKAIKRSDVTQYAKNWNLTYNCYNSPKPFTSEYWAIDTDDENEYPGLIGKIVVACSFDNLEPFYK